jgi:hypothetical protein
MCPLTGVKPNCFKAVGEAIDGLEVWLLGDGGCERVPNEGVVVGHEDPRRGASCWT